MPWYFTYMSQGTDNSASARAVQDTDYMVEKTYHLAPYLDPFGAFLAEMARYIGKPEISALFPSFLSYRYRIMKKFKVYYRIIIVS